MIALGKWMLSTLKKNILRKIACLLITYEVTYSCHIGRCMSNIKQSSVLALQRELEVRMGYFDTCLQVACIVI